MPAPTSAIESALQAALAALQTATDQVSSFTDELHALRESTKSELEAEKIAHAETLRSFQQAHALLVSEAQAARDAAKVDRDALKDLKDNPPADPPGQVKASQKEVEDLQNKVNAYAAALEAAVARNTTP